MQPNPLFAIGLVIGLAIGIAFGVSIGNVAFGMPTGAIARHCHWYDDGKIQ